MRRRSYAGKQSYLLDSREDFFNPMLILSEEEQKIRAGIPKCKANGKVKGEQQQQQQSGPTYNSRSNIQCGE